MKLVHKALFLCVAVLLSACSNNTPSRLSKDQIDDKSYAVSYGVTGQTYKDRVTANYDIASFTKGVSDWYYGKVNMPIEQIRDDEYIRKGADDIIHLCVKTIIDDEHKAEQEKPQAKPKKASHKTSKKHK